MWKNNPLRTLNNRGPARILWKNFAPPTLMQNINDRIKREQQQAEDLERTCLFHEREREKFLSKLRRNLVVIMHREYFDLHDKDNKSTILMYRFHYLGEHYSLVDLRNGWELFNKHTDVYWEGNEFLLEIGGYRNINSPEAIEFSNMFCIASFDHERGSVASRKNLQFTGLEIALIDVKTMQRMVRYYALQRIIDYKSCNPYDKEDSAEAIFIVESEDIPTQDSTDKLSLETLYGKEGAMAAIEQGMSESAAGGGKEGEHFEIDRAKSLFRGVLDSLIGESIVDKAREKILNLGEKAIRRPVVERTRKMRTLHEERKFARYNAPFLDLPKGNTGLIEWDINTGDIINIIPLTPLWLGRDHWERYNSTGGLFLPCAPLIPMSAIGISTVLKGISGLVNVPSKLVYDSKTGKKTAKGAVVIGPMSERFDEEFGSLIHQDPSIIPLQMGLLDEVIGDLYNNISYDAKYRKNFFVNVADACASLIRGALMNYVADEDNNEYEDYGNGIIDGMAYNGMKHWLTGHDASYTLFGARNMFRIYKRDVLNPFFLKYMGEFLMWKQNDIDTHPYRHFLDLNSYGEPADCVVFTVRGIGIPENPYAIPTSVITSARYYDIAVVSEDDGSGSTRRVFNIRKDLSWGYQNMQAARESDFLTMEELFANTAQTKENIQLKLAYNLMYSTHYETTVFVSEQGNMYISSPMIPSNIVISYPRHSIGDMMNGSDCRVMLDNLCNDIHCFNGFTERIK